MTGESRLPVLPPEQYAQLKADVEQNGVLTPVLVTPDGTIIDGHTRTRIANELGIDVPTHVVDTNDPESVGLVVNVLRRHCDPASRDRIITYLRDERGLSTEQIAGRIGWHQRTIERSSSVQATSAARTDERARRRAWVAYLRDQGASCQQVADALNISVHTVWDDSRSLGIQYDRLRKLPVDPTPITDWHEKDPPKLVKPKRKPKPRPLPTTVRFVEPERVTPPPLYQRSVTLQLWRDVVRGSEDNNAVGKLSQDALDADAAGDHGWYVDARGVIATARAYLDRLSSVLDDQAARERGATDWRERDDLARLRLVDNHENGDTA